MKKRTTVVAACVAAMAVTTSLVGTAQADDPSPPKGAAQGWAQQSSGKNQAKPSAIPTGDRARLLGPSYKNSKDVAVTTSGDGSGFHVLTAAEKDGYELKTAATLFEDGFASDTWIGNSCVTGSGKYAAVAYAPRMFTNKPELMVRGAFAAIVSLESGKVTKLPFQASMAYFSPGCGTGDQAVFTQLSHDGDKAQKTRLITVDATTGKVGSPVAFPGQVTSAIPTKDGIVAAHGAKVVRINGAKEKVLATTTAVPFQITADADGGVTFIDRQIDKDAKKKPTSWAKHLGAAAVKAGAKNTPVTVASGKLHAWDLTGTARGEVFITGNAATKGSLPKRVKNPGALAKDTSMSTYGHTALVTAWADGKTTLVNPKDAAKARPARTTLRVLATGKETALDLEPGKSRIGAAKSTAKSPALPDAAPAGSGAAKDDSAGISTQMGRTQAITAIGDSPSEGAGERYCAVPRNDVKKQAFQPTPRQVEWAVDQAVVGELNHYRGTNWKNTGTGGYSPQGLFPPIVLGGDPNGTLDNEDPDVTDRWHIPSQVMLGVTAQETNMWQATRFAVPGVTANSLIGNYYGVDYAASGQQLDPWQINWADADCGYGITQATDGMRLAGKTKPGETALSPLAQDAIALDYTANVAAGARILSDKWNQTYKAGMKVNGGHPKWIENWFFALWAYNSGFYETPDSAGHSGLGWTNNPANPLWKANRVPFLESATDPSKDDYSHAARPQEWPYQEKVIGWAGRPISAMFAPGNFQAGYLASWWNSVADRSSAKPPIDLFCGESNFCNSTKIGDNDSNDPGLGACMIDSGDSDTNPHWLHCWWDESVQWKDCDTDAACGYQVHRFNTTYPEQADAASYPPNCASTGLPANAMIVDNLPNGTTPAGSDSRGCGAVTSKGTFDFAYVPWDTPMDLTHDGTDNPTTVTTYPGKIDTHQIGAGYGNHFWFAHTRTPESYPANANRMKVTGTWTLGQKITTHGGQAKVFAHIPDHGARTGAATYKIATADGEREATISQKANQSNKWVDLGAYNFGDVTPTVALDNFNGGDGSANIAFDAIAFSPGTYNGMNLGTFPDPDPNAPEPAPVEPEEDITDSPFSTAAGFSADTAMAAPMAATSTASCSTVDHSLTRKRTTACIHSDYGMTHYTNTVADGSAAFDFYNTIHLDPKSDEVSQVSTIRLKSMDGVVNTATLDYQAKCRGYCSITSVDWNGSKTFTKGDTLQRTVTTRFKWTPSGATKNTITPYWYFTGKVNSTSVAKSTEFERSELDIRCDNEVANAGTGCVFSGYKPTYVMNSKMYPGAAAHIALMWKKTKITYGRAGGKPLKYLGQKLATDGSGKTQADRNRLKICGRSSKNFVPYTGNGSPDSGTGLFSDLWGRTDVASCDEFAFANSYQSGGTPTSNGGTNPVPTNGSDCVQTYVKRNPDSTSSLHLRPDYPMPTWNEPCGRSSMSNWQNTESMGLKFAGFIRAQRLQQDDSYWVDLDGFTLP